MRYIWITRELPFAAARGSQAYTNGLVRSLAGAGATGTIICYEFRDSTDIHLPGLAVAQSKEPAHIRALSLLSRWPSDAFRLRSETMERDIRAHFTADVDTVFIDYYAMGWVLPLLERLQSERSRPALLVYVSHNYEQLVRRQVAESTRNPLMRAVLRIDAAKVARLERELVSASDLVTANTDDDKAAYEADEPGKAVLTLMPAYSGTIRPTEPITPARRRQAVIVGAFVWIAKRDSLRNFVAAADAPFRKAGIELLIVGEVPEALMSEIRSKTDICKFAGFVDSIRDALGDARIGIMPDEVGGGFKHKYLEYIFAGLPVAAIRSQAAGLPLDIERDMMPADTIAGLVDAVVKNIDDIAALDAMRERAFSACAKAFDWADRGVKLRATVDAMLAARGG